MEFLLKAVQDSISESDKIPSADITHTAQSEPQVIQTVFTSGDNLENSSASYLNISSSTKPTLPTSGQPKPEQRFSANYVPSPNVPIYCNNNFLARKLNVNDPRLHKEPHTIYNSNLYSHRTRESAAHLRLFAYNQQSASGADPSLSFNSSQGHDPLW